MAVIFERIVAEDFHRGVGLVDVTAPAGGTVQGTKVGLHTWQGGWVSVTDFGAIGDGSVNDAAAIQAALDTTLNVYLPFGDYNIGSTSLTPYPGQTIKGAGIGNNLTFRSRLLYSGNGSAILDEHAPNVSGYGLITFEDFYIVGSGAASTGAGIELLAGGFAFYIVRRVRIGGTFKYGLIADGTICSKFKENIFENGQGVTDSCHLWIVNGDDRRAGQALGFSNVIAIEDNQFNGADYGMIDDGGDGHRIVGNNFNGHSVSLQVAGLTDFSIIQNDFENAGRITGDANIKFSDRSGVGGGSINIDKSPCRGGFIQANALQQDMASTGTSYMVKFETTTAGAYHRGIMATGNVLGNRLGRSAGWGVAGLAHSFIGYNNDDSTGAHFTGGHYDEFANTLLTPGGTTDSPADCFPTLQPQLSGAKTWTPGAIADGATASTTLTVDGAAVVDVCSASHDALGAADVFVHAHVQAADTVRIVVENRSGGPVNIASGISQVFVTKRNPGI